MKCTDVYDHRADRCEAMSDVDCDTKYPGEPATCCICIEHDCEVYHQYLREKGNNEAH